MNNPSRISKHPRRSGVSALELLLWMPVLIILLLAVIEFGLIIANLNQLAQASNLGAKIASTTFPVTLTPVSIGVEAQLRHAQIEKNCRVILDETVTSPIITTTTAGVCPCLAPPVNTLPERTVRVTVCVELTNLAPNLLASFGFDLTGRVAKSTTTMPFGN